MATVNCVDKAQRDPASWLALRLALIAVAIPLLAFVPGLVPEVSTVLLLGLAGGVVSIFAMVHGVFALRARRAAQSSSAVAVTAIAISLLPLAGVLLLIPTLRCQLGEACGGG